MNRLEELLLRFSDQNLTAGEVAELKELLAEPEARATLFEHFWMSSTILDVSRGWTAAEAEVRGEPAEPSPGLWPADKKARQAASSARETCRHSLFPVRRAWALAACAAIMAGGCFLFFSHRPAEIATLLAAQPGVILERNHDASPVVKSKSLRAGDTVRVGPGAGAVIRYPDSTQLKVEADSILTLKMGDKKQKAAGKWVELRQGSLVAEVAKQAQGRPMRFQTPDALITVVGTRLAIEVAGERTVVKVTEGRVRLHRLADGSQEDVAAEETTEAGAAPAETSSTTLNATHAGEAGTTLYSNDMEAGTTYDSGMLVTTPPPRGGLKSEQRPANHTIYSSPALHKPLPASVNHFTCNVWVNDDNNASQLYRLGLRLRNPATGRVATFYASGRTAGAGWSLVSEDRFTPWVNSQLALGYTELHRIMLRAYNRHACVTYYIDDVLVQYRQ